MLLQQLSGKSTSGGIFEVVRHEKTDSDNREKKRKKERI